MISKIGSRVGIVVALSSCQPQVESQASQTSGPPVSMRVECMILNDYLQQHEGQAQATTVLLNAPAIPYNFPLSEQDIERMVGEFRDGGETEQRQAEFREMLTASLPLTTLSPTEACPELADLRGYTLSDSSAPDDLQELVERGGIERGAAIAVMVPYVDLEHGVAAFDVTRICGMNCIEQITVEYASADNGTWRFLQESE